MRRNIPDDNLAYPILLNIDDKYSGSGFQINCDQKLYLVTAKHVLYNDKNVLHGKILKLDCPSRNVLDNTITKMEIKLDVVKITYHPKSDVAIIHMGSLGEPDSQNIITTNYFKGISIPVRSISPTIHTQRNDILLLKDVLVSNDVFMYGYPTSLGLKNSRQFDFSKPLLRKGIIANTYPNLGTIILDCPVYYGNSGGPVVQVSFEGKDNAIRYDYNLIGVVSQFIPFEEEWINTKNHLINKEWSNSGYSIAVCMDKVFELIDK
jgi:hypothetical protein